MLSFLVLDQRFQIDRLLISLLTRVDHCVVHDRVTHVSIVLFRFYEKLQCNVPLKNFSRRCDCHAVVTNILSKFCVLHLIQQMQHMIQHMPFPHALIVGSTQSCL